MKVLQFTTEQHWRGGERQVFYTVQGLAEKGVDVHLLCLKGSAIEVRVREKGVAVHTVNTRAGAFLFLLRYGSRYHVIHAQNPHAHLVSVLTQPFHQRPVVYTRRVDFPLRNAFSRLIYQRTDAIVAITHFIEQVVASAGVNVCGVIPEAVQERILNHNRAREFLRARTLAGRRIVATVAALVPHKDPFTMVKAIHLLRKERGDFVFLHFGAGPLREALLRKVSRYNLEGIYHLPGFVEDVEDFFSVFDVFVMSSRMEGLGSSILDAFLYRVPVVATAAGGMKEIVEGRGWLCAPGDPECLATGISRMLDDEQLRASVTAKALEYVKSFHNTDRMVNQYIQLYERLKK